MQDIHRVPLQPFGRVDRAEDQVIVVEVGRSGKVLRRVRWVERQLSKKCLSIAEASGNVLQLLKIAQSCRHVVVCSLQQRLIHDADAVDLFRKRRGFAGGEVSKQLDQLPPDIDDAGGHFGTGPGGEIAVGSR